MSDKITVESFRNVIDDGMDYSPTHYASECFELAKTFAIGFANHIGKKEFCPKKQGEVVVWDGRVDIYTTEQLLELYLKDSNE